MEHSFPPRDNDLPLTEAVATMQRLMNEGYIVQIKWTCPACGERCVADAAGEVHTGGYHHTEKADGSFCGAVYTEQRFGLRAYKQLTPGPQ